MFCINGLGAFRPGRRQWIERIMRTATIAGMMLAGLAASTAQADEAQRQAVHLLSVAPTRVFAEVVAQDYVARSGKPAPLVETVGADATHRRFCAGLGLDAPDMMLVPGTMDTSDKAACFTNGVTRIAEIKLGYEALVLANKANAQAFDLTPKQIFLAVARRIPRGGELVRNTFTHWRQIDSALPDLPIEIIGPAKDSVAAEAFRQHFLHVGCRAAGLPADLSPSEKVAVCNELRNDGHYRPAFAANFADAIEAVRNNPVPLAVLPLSLMRHQGEGLATNAIDGVLPTEAAIAFGEYRAGSPIHLYVKLEQAKLVAGLTDFARSIAAQSLAGPDGQLIQQGLVPLPYRDQIHQKLKANGLAKEQQGEPR